MPDIPQYLKQHNDDVLGKCLSDIAIKTATLAFARSRTDIPGVVKVVAIDRAAIAFAGVGSERPKRLIAGYRLFVVTLLNRSFRGVYGAPSRSRIAFYTSRVTEEEREEKRRAIFSNGLGTL